ncbi:hypothetical protein LS70_007675 [Helicobacter sp. MIT 11-5569]|uniref:hypothetical protein n=1 Tax=Helicobacter sp. MIT 11-5569 TaxID=1548151 RepID=UPI00051FF182|nr:hypothetical protein [Helicobacter sp. MIT 11-5569]TLD81384.1 hypothetical protein LS70_007675 [Helicobacter sp. MIT 11-5569]
MKILYAPSSRCFSDDLHRNVACGFDSFVLESLVGLENAEVVYLPHSKSDKKIVESILNIFGDLVKSAKVAPKTIDVVVSDMSSLVFKYVLWTQNPGLLCLFGFHSISYPENDKYFTLLENCAIPVHSCKELKESLRNYQTIKALKAPKIKEILEGVAL